MGSSNRLRLSLLSAAALIAGLAFSTQAVMFPGTDDPSYNTTAPVGDFDGSGWEWQGQWGPFLGTPIGPRHFIAAKHVGGAVGQVFTFAGMDFVTTAFVDDPQSDLRIWQVDGVFPAFAPLNTATNETGRTMAIFGRGTQRGIPITTTLLSTNYVKTTVNIRTLGLTAKQAKALYPGATIKGDYMTYNAPTIATNTIANGWRWGAADGVMRWGSQRVYSTDAAYIVGQVAAGSGPSSCALSGGDSSGGVFINDGGGWKLAGIAYAVEGPFSTTASGEPFNAALLDKTGLYKSGTYYAPGGAARPSAFFATRISTRIDWIRSVIGQ